MIKPSVVCALLFGATCAKGVISFSLTFNDGFGETWDSARQAVVTQAANEWGSLFVENYGINVDISFSDEGTEGYLGQWQGSASAPIGASVRPWQYTAHTIRFNSALMDPGLDNYLWWDGTPSDNSDQPFEAWDALSVARHEFGHLMGFTSGLYVDNFFQGNEVDLWGDLLSGDPLTFDAGGLNVPMANSAHVDNSGISANDLMVPALANSVRREISELDLQMLTLAYDYALIPELSSASLVFGMVSLFLLAGRRRRG